MMELLRDPLFWALLSMTALSAGNAIVSNVLPPSRLIGLAVVGGFTLARAILVLPLCPQPRFDLADLHLPLGLGLMLAAFALLLPVFRVHWTTGPNASEPLLTTGVYRLVRHPAYLGNLLLGLGWALVFRSTLGVALTGVWWLGFWLHAMIEEATLERVYGDAYRRYKTRVRGRILPALPR